MSDEVVLFEPSGTDLVLVDAAADSVRAVRQYVGTQLSPRSRQNALDALRRIARLVLGPEARVEQFPWPALTYEAAMAIRRGLYDRTVEGAITPGTANLTLSHLRGIIRSMYAMKLVTHEQLAIAHPKLLKNIRGSRTARGTALSPVDERAIREAARGLKGYRGSMLDAAIVASIGTGMRREEVADVELGKLAPGMLTIVGKGNAERIMPVDAQVQVVLGAWTDQRAILRPDHARLFCSPQRPDRELSPWSLWSLVRQAAHAAFGDKQPCDDGCRCLAVITGPHDFRRTFATRLLAQGLDIRQVQVLMGHASPTTTARYDKRATTELFEKRLAMRVLA